MRLSRGALALVLLLGCFTTVPAAVRPLDSSSSRPARKTKPKRRAVAPAPPQAAPVSVSYKDGLLSISADGAPLRDVLAQVHERTGATIDAPADLDERVDVQLGPGPAVQIVAALLERTNFNFVIAAVPKDPRAVQSIQLTPKPSLLEDLPPASAANQEERATKEHAQAKAHPASPDDGMWNDVEAPGGTPPPPADTAVRPPK